MEECRRIATAHPSVPHLTVSQRSIDNNYRKDYQIIVLNRSVQTIQRRADMADRRVADAQVERDAVQRELNDANIELERLRDAAVEHDEQLDETFQAFEAVTAEANSLRRENVELRASRESPE